MCEGILSEGSLVATIILSVLVALVAAALKNVVIDGGLIVIVGLPFFFPDFVCCCCCCLLSIVKLPVVAAITYFAVALLYEPLFCRPDCELPTVRCGAFTTAAFIFMDFCNWAIYLKSFAVVASSYWVSTIATFWNRILLHWSLNLPTRAIPWRASTVQENVFAMTNAIVALSHL